VDTGFNGEDISMNILVASMNGQKHPINVVSYKPWFLLMDFDVIGISHGKGHDGKRDHVLNELQKFFGYNILDMVITRMKVRLAN
jgi:hypothetical protein